MKRIYYIAGGVLAPGMLLAQSLSTAGSTIRDFIIGDVLGLISMLIPLLVAVAFIVFFWGLTKFILHSDNAKDIQNGKNYMFWGIIALFILITFRAIISFFVADFGFGNGNVVPTLPESETGTVTTSETIRNPDGSIRLPDGTIVMPDGTIITP